MDDVPEVKEDRRAVIDRKLVRTSVSAIKKFQTCKRQWWFRYVKGLPDPQGAGAKLGEECHARVEKYLTTREDCLGEIERAGMDMIPEPGPGLLVEEPFTEEFPLFSAGVRLAGFIDLVDTRFLGMTGVVRVVDWKFKKDIVKYGTNAAKIQNVDDEDGLQMVGYGAWVAKNRKRFFGVQSVVLAHAHFQTVSKKGKHPTNYIQTQPIPLDKLESAWETVSLTVEQMKLAASETDPSKVEPNEKACWKYGGCPYRDVCPLSAGDKLAANMMDAFRPTKEKPNMGLLDDLDDDVPAKAAPAKAAPPPAPAAPSKKGLIDDQSKGDDEELRKIQAAKKAAAETGEQANWKPVLCSDCGTDLGKRPSGHQISPSLCPNVKQHKGAQIQPPDAPKSDPALAARVDAPKPEAPAEAKGKRGKKAAPVPDAPAPDAPTSESIQAAPTVDRAGPIRLWFGKAPTGRDFEVLNIFASKIETEVLAKFVEKGLPAYADIRTASGEAVGFGKWKGFLAAHTKNNLPPAGDYVWLPGDERVDAVAHALLDTGAALQ